MILDKFTKWSEHSYSPAQRLLLIIPAGLTMAIVIPFVYVVGASKLDAWLHWPNVDLGIFNRLLGIICLIAGVWLISWSVEVQFVIGRGTPAPMMPTRHMVIEGPYRFCRNPMILGVFTACAGLGIYIGSPAAIAISILFLMLATIYLKVIEEKELALRFGEAYLEYKKSTPFFIPRFK
jgi:protein-S-isoprenylcysteine O-methyltransferase Ste14